MFFQGNQGEVDPVVGVEHEMPGADDGAQVIQWTQVQIAQIVSNAVSQVFLFFSERAARRGGGGVRCQTFSFSFFPCSADHERDWPPCKVVFFGLATNALNVRNNNNN